ncbi:MAG TPA: quinone oxidoreductase [Acidimicrobiales bacterium]|nr:quinone oxidoreductase [Acidimicrobiales bacterium]
MRAIGILAYGDESVLEHWDVPVPVPGPSDVLVRVAFAGVNFMDVHTRQGKYEGSRTYPLHLPLTLGMEGAGTVVDVGLDVTDVGVGDRVAWCLSWGSYAEFAVVPLRRIVEVPPDVELAVAAASLFQGCTAHYLCHDVGGLGPESTCLIHAASGAIGQLLIQFAKKAGATVYATTSTTEKAQVALERGADEVFLYDDDGFADEVLRATVGRGVDVVFDALGAPTLRDSFRATRTRGLVVNYGSVAGPIHDLDPVELGESGSLWLTRPRLADYVSDRTTIQRRADAVFEGLTDGSLVVQRAGEFTFDDVARAQAALEERRQIGKALLRITL